MIATSGTMVGKNSHSSSAKSHAAHDRLGRGARVHRAALAARDRRRCPCRPWSARPGAWPPPRGACRTGCRRARCRRGSASPVIIFQICGGSRGGRAGGIGAGEDPGQTAGPARWSMPLTPHMSPAAIGCSVVRSRGWPSRSKRAPIAASTASGQPSAEEEETVTTAPSGISRAASAAERMRGGPWIRSRWPVSRCVRAASSVDSATLSDLTPSSPVAAGCASPGDRLLEQPHRAHVEALVRERQHLLALGAAQQDLAFGRLGHAVAADQRTFLAMHLEAGRRIAGGEGVVELREEAASGSG